MLCLCTNLTNIAYFSVVLGTCIGSASVGLHVTAVHLPRRYC